MSDIQSETKAMLHDSRNELKKERERLESERNYFNKMLAERDREIQDLKCEMKKLKDKVLR